MFQRVLFNFRLAIEGVLDNRLRAILTALGIVFGVGAVIAMLAIGTGAKQEILDRMKLIGTNNIEITALLEQEEGEGEEDGQTSGQRPYSSGLTLDDVRHMEEILPNIDRTSPEIVLPVNVVYNGRLKRAQTVGVTNAFFELNSLKLAQGRLFHDWHLEQGMTVCVIGDNVRARFFAQENPIGKSIKCGDTWLTIIGVLASRNLSSKSLEDLGIRDYNADVYIPIHTALLRYKNRAAISDRQLGEDNGDEEETSTQAFQESQNYHQLDRLVVRVQDSRQLISTASVIGRMLQRRHNDLKDFRIEVPELLLEQEQQTQETFNIVLAVIAGISLLVGGIGIMNIMLASVLERIKEIGVRRSLGATRLDIILQFVFESVFISLLGGLLGVALGIGAAQTIAAIADISTVITAWSVVLSFGVAASVGLIFGIIPARRAAQLDPIKALRND